jgi:hypothetical protein
VIFPFLSRRVRSLRHAGAFLRAVNEFRGRRSERLHPHSPAPWIVRRRWRLSGASARDATTLERDEAPASSDAVSSAWRQLQSSATAPSDHGLIAVARGPALSGSHEVAPDRAARGPPWRVTDNPRSMMVSLRGHLPGIVTLGEARVATKARAKSVSCPAAEERRHGEHCPRAPLSCARPTIAVRLSSGPR